MGEGLTWIMAIRKCHWSSSISPLPQRHALKLLSFGIPLVVAIHHQRTRRPTDEADRSTVGSLIPPNTTLKAYQRFPHRHHCHSNLITDPPFSPHQNAHAVVADKEQFLELSTHSLSQVPLRSLVNLVHLSPSAPQFYLVFHTHLPSSTSTRTRTTRGELEF